MNNDNKKYELKESDCFTDRKTIGMVEIKEGEIVLIDNANFGIRYKGGNTLMPCNLPAPLQNAGIKIIFSGAVKETKLTELVAGQPFVLTKVEERKP